MENGCRFLIALIRLQNNCIKFTQILLCDDIFFKIKTCYFLQNMCMLDHDLLHYFRAFSCGKLNGFRHIISIDIVIKRYLFLLINENVSKRFSCGKVNVFHRVTHQPITGLRSSECSLI